jgi:multiple sugar transport system permease protein
VTQMVENTKPVAQTGRKGLTLNQRRYVAAALLLAPVILLRLFTTLYPFVQTILLSVQRYNPAFPPQEYVGLGNFEKLAGDLVFQSSIEFTLIFVLGSSG